jgi:HlyD family secretion protein
MKNRIIFIIAGLGIVAGLIAAYVFGIQKGAQPPVFAPTSSPYASAIYTNGIVESVQAGGSNINVYPEVSGVVADVPVVEGQEVKAGMILLHIDDTVQRATTEQLRLQAEAARSLLAELKAQPRKETLEIAKAQVELAQASLQVAHDQYAKRLASVEIDRRSVSKDVLDTAADAEQQAKAALDVAQRQYDLTRAGAWSYDIENQAQTSAALTKSYEAARALLDKYTIRALNDGVILAVNTARGSYVQGVGTYDTYTQSNVPLLVMSAMQDYLAVRCYVDEILISRMPDAAHARGQLAIRGSDIKIPLEFVRIQPYVSPKIELSDERQERVDLRVLPVIFRFKKEPGMKIYPGQLVDVYIGQQ